jgi:hypothetical protein
MPVSIGNLTADVVVEPDGNAGAGATPAPPPAERQASVRAELTALAREAMRTRAEGFDD